MTNWQQYYNLETISDRDERLFEFRSEVCHENGASLDYMQNFISHKKTMEYVKSLRQADVEEIWQSEMASDSVRES
jgi:hypothetical protein